MNDSEGLDLKTLMTCAEKLARQTNDGHLTLLRFTSGWKCAVGTPDLRSWAGAQEVWLLPAFPTLEEALLHLITVRQGIPDVPPGPHPDGLRAPWLESTRVPAPKPIRGGPRGLDDSIF